MQGIQLDVEDPRAVDAFAARIRDQVPTLNVLINNAGISRPEDLTADALDVSVARSIIDTNIVSVLQLTAGLLPILKRQPSATIITTTSGLAFMPRAEFPTYCASKAFLHSWLQSLRFQLRKTSVEVLELAPPYVQTELTGPGQAIDPRAVPLADYIAEVIQRLGGPTPPRGEILVEQSAVLRWAEQNHTYDQRFLTRNEH
jgi:uncharacterized oxidoreductase